ncbi:hypothetical protein A9G43_04005 [Gilliamella sp. Occ3-1]|uniref:phage tail assembly chaperone n=1 Tax=Gilliamella sp. Occ3-1 TaxID=3120253 RepID=UPI00080DB591|nr:phage tail assembly chaperone [Gilliamella apicola]OCG71925.1 hypothetical protein A9G43_04005 [Gilliamella apicola]
MNLKQIITAKNSGFRTKTVHVAEWGVEVTIREPLHTDFNRYIKTIKDITDNEKLTDREKDLLNIEAEATLFATVLLDDNGDFVFSNDIDDLVKSYGPVHTRLVNEAFNLLGLKSEPIKEAEKK